MTEDHFIELRQFLAKKARNRVNEDRNRTKLVSQGGKTNNDLDFGSTMGYGGKDILSSPSSNPKNKLVQYTTKEKTQCLENERFLITKKVRVEYLPKGLAESAKCDEERDINGNIVYERDENLRK